MQLFCHVILPTHFLATLANIYENYPPAISSLRLLP
ncbi:unnamed protein product [Brassica oleracea var. botrytis]